MKKIILGIVVLMLFAAACIAGAQVDTQYAGYSPNIIVSLAKQEPDQVEPGGQVEASFKLDNNGTEAENVMFEIVPEYPFSLIPGEIPSKTIGVLGNSQYGRQSFTIKYKLKVAPDAADGNHVIKVRYKTDNYNGWTTLDNLKIRVQTHDAILIAEKITTTPLVTPPGERTKLRIELKNYATSILKDIKVSLDLGSTSSTPFGPVGSTNEKVVSYIDPLATVPVEFELLVDPDAVSKTYRIPMTLRYSDALNKDYNRTNLVTIVVGDEPDVSIGIESATVYRAGTAGDITIKIVNKGLPDMKFINVKLAQSSSYRIISPSEVYIGKIDSDDYETADFKIYVESGSDKKLALPLTVEYRDANNKDYRNAVNLELPLYSSSEAKKFGLVKGNGKMGWIALIIIAAAGFFGYRFWKKRKKHA